MDFIERCGVTVEKIDVLETLYDDLVAANRDFNLTRITERADFWTRHVADSLSIGIVIPEIMTDDLTVVDVGCGGGFPILPLAWANSRLRITGLVPGRRKADFVAGQIQKHVFQNASVECLQAREYTETRRLALVRAVGGAGKLVKECRRLVAPGGRIVFYKTPTTVEKELDLTKRECAKFGFNISVSDEFALPCHGGKRQFIILEKTG